MAAAGLPTVIVAPSDLRRPLFDFASPVRPRSVRWSPRASWSPAPSWIPPARSISRPSPGATPHEHPAPAGRDVRTFRAADPRSALEAVKTALGEDAIIIDNPPGRGRPVEPPQIEITASNEAPSRADAAAAAADRGVQVELGALRRLVEELRMRIPAPPSPPRRRPR